MDVVEAGGGSGRAFPSAEKGGEIKRRSGIACEIRKWSRAYSDKIWTVEKLGGNPGAVTRYLVVLSVVVGMVTSFDQLLGDGFFSSH